MTDEEILEFLEKQYELITGVSIPKVLITGRSGTDSRYAIQNVAARIRLMLDEWNRKND